ncbi:MAG: hypothetical protein ACLQER_13510, partial [Streptosporangiaceae bacterium]
MEKGATTLVTSGAAQSNHARLTAAAACRLGLGCWLVLRGEPPPVRGTQPRLHGSHPAGRDPSDRAECVRCGCASWVLLAAEDVAKVLHGPSPVEQCRVVLVLGAEVLDQGHIVVEVERPD